MSVHAEYYGVDNPTPRPPVATYRSRIIQNLHRRQARSQTEAVMRVRPPSAPKQQTSSQPLVGQQTNQSGTTKPTAAATSSSRPVSAAYGSMIAALHRQNSTKEQAQLGAEIAPPCAFDVLESEGISFSGRRADPQAELQYDRVDFAKHKVHSAQSGRLPLSVHVESALSMLHHGELQPQTQAHQLLSSMSLQQLQQSNKSTNSGEGTQLVRPERSGVMTDHILQSAASTRGYHEETLDRQRMDGHRCEELQQKLFNQYLEEERRRERKPPFRSTGLKVKEFGWPEEEKDVEFERDLQRDAYFHAQRLRLKESLEAKALVAVKREVARERQHQSMKANYDKAMSLLDPLTVQRTQKVLNESLDRTFAANHDKKFAELEGTDRLAKARKQAAATVARQMASLQYEKRFGSKPSQRPTPRVRADAELAAFNVHSARPSNNRLLSQGTQKIVKELGWDMRGAKPVRLECEETPEKALWESTAEQMECIDEACCDGDDTSSDE